MSRFGVNAVLAGQMAEDNAYRNMQNQYATQEATRVAEANALARMQNNRQQPVAGLNMSGDYGTIPGVVKIKTTPQTPAAPAPKQQATGKQTTKQETPAAANATVPVSIGSLYPSSTGGDILPNDNPWYYTAAMTPNIHTGGTTYTGRQQYYDLPESAVKTYNSNLEYIPKYRGTDLYDKINKYAKQAGVDSNILHALALQETAGGQILKDSPQGASGALQIMPGTYRDVLMRLPTLTKDKGVLQMLNGMNPDWSKATPEDKLKGGILYAKMLSILGGKEVTPSRIFAGYFGGESRLKGDLPGVADATGRSLPDYVAMTTGYYNTMNPQAQSDMLAVANVAQPTANGQVAQVQGQPTQVTQGQGGLDVSGTYAAPVAQGTPAASSAAQEAGLTRLAKGPAQGLPEPIQNLIQRRQVLRTHANALAQTGAFGQYYQLAAQEAALDADLYNQLAELGAAEMTQFGAPQRLMSLLSSFSGRKAQVQLRSDGKLDLYLNGEKVSGKDGLSASRLSTMVKNMVSAQARAQYTAAATEAAKQQASLMEAQLKGQYDLAGRSITGQYNIAAAKAHGAASGGGVKALGTLNDGTIVAYDRNGGLINIMPGGTQEVNGEEVATGPTVRPIAGLYGFSNTIQ